MGSASAFLVPPVDILQRNRPTPDCRPDDRAGTDRETAHLIHLLDTVDMAVFVFAMDGTPAHRSPSATEFATGEAGEVLCAAVQDLARRLALPTQVPGPPTQVREVVEGTSRYTLSGVRLDPGVVHEDPAVLVVVTDRSDEIPAMHVIQEEFGLTERQTEVAMHLADRLTTPEIAERLCISPHTAARHVEAVLAKLSLTDRRDVQERLREAG